ncbi:MAG TPA: class I SAM-dependent methyltransferase [Mycobacteriales bacterium]|nr:class I SAM-dependent methyltransferase [Mycobacteriales bacterium]
MPELASYRAKRANPSRLRPEYLHLRDLNQALKDALTGKTGRWLDYGSHTSPYEEYLAGRLDTADIEGTQTPSEPTYRFRPGNPCPAGDATFDGILSTQVLEHVADPAFYLADARRMLKPGGELVLSTHGIWRDHPSPRDFRRWTTDGLAEDLRRAGFTAVTARPVTCGARALTTLGLIELKATLNRHDLTRGPAVKKAFRAACLIANLGADIGLGSQAVAPEQGRNALYVAIVATARSQAPIG